MRQAGSVISRAVPGPRAQKTPIHERTASTMLEALIDAETPAATSLALRYGRALLQLGPPLPVTLEDFAACSISEGARVLPLATYGGVEILLADESSSMSTGTYKDLDAMITMAILRRARVPAVVVASGGNLGTSLAAYARRLGVNVYSFLPRTTLFKMRHAALLEPNIKLITVDLPERQVKSLATAFAKTFGLPQVPDLRWRLAASALRALHIVESTFLAGTPIDALAQTMCAGYGPAGIYHCFSELCKKQLLPPRAVPRFLGFQQEANAPMVRAWSAGDRELMDRHVKADPSRYIEPGLYNVNPAQNYPRVLDILDAFGGNLLALSQQDYERHTQRVLGWLMRAGIHLTRDPMSGDVVEKTGLLTGVGIAKAIDEGRLRPGERVLYLLTGGVHKAPSRAQIEPVLNIDASRTEADWVEVLGRCFGLAEHGARGPYTDDGVPLAH